MQYGRCARQSPRGRWDASASALIGGASRSAVVAEAAAEIFGVAVTVPVPQEYVALGAARQAAWALHGGAEPPQWPAAATFEIPAADDGAVGSRTRSTYAHAREALYGS